MLEALRMRCIEHLIPLKTICIVGQVRGKTEDWAGLRTVGMQQQIEDRVLTYNFNTVLISRTHHSIKAMDGAHQRTKDILTLLLPPGAWGSR